MLRRHIITSRLKYFCALLAMVLAVTAGVDTALAAKKHYDNWKGVAADMGRLFTGARADIASGEYKAAYQKMNKAYFGHYEIQGFEKNVMYAISRARVNHIEARFAAIKHVLLGNNDSMNKAELEQEVEDLKVKVYRDAMVLDGDITRDAPDTEGLAVYAALGESKPESAGAVAAESIAKTAPPEKQVEKAAVEENAPKKESAPVVDPDWITFMTAFGLLVREGLEAILVIAAIVAYLIKTGNSSMIKSVYTGCGAAVVASALLAWALEALMGEASGVARELLEGWTMFLAVGVLFYVSNWMLSKSDTEKWERYIGEKVSQSINSKDQKVLVFAAFIAVMREGAELILFYKAAFTGGMDSTTHIVYGILAGTALLILIWVLFRYFSVKLPLKAFFVCTSILLFLMCISFMGKGVIELTEADVIVGRTVIPCMNGFSIDILNIYDRAETLIPQAMIVIAALWTTLPHLFGSKKK